MIPLHVAPYIGSRFSLLGGDRVVPRTYRPTGSDTPKVSGTPLHPKWHTSFTSNHVWRELSKAIFTKIWILYQYTTINSKTEDTCLKSWGWRREKKKRHTDIHGHRQTDRELTRIIQPLYQHYVNVGDRRESERDRYRDRYRETNTERQR